MRFGVFDHLDDQGVERRQQLEGRLRLTELYDRLGFHAYHIAEHHGSPLGIAPAPHVFLAAVGQRTERLRLGALVNVLPLRNPVRLLEEVCLLDQLTGGRLELGIGRGASPIESAFLGADADPSRERFDEAFAVLMAGLTGDTLTHRGPRLQIDAMPMITRPLQQPHPPLWYAPSRPERAAWAAEHGMCTMTLWGLDHTRGLTDAYRARWGELGRAERDMPLLGLNRHLVIAEREDEARAIAERAFARFLASFEHLWNERGVAIPPVITARTFGEWQASGNAFAGTPDGARAFVADVVERTQITYFTAGFAFGDIGFDVAARSARLFAETVMPAFGEEELAS